MYFNVWLKNFRCFADVGPVTVAPITVLIGENSAGKTSFLAALRELVETFDRSASSHFNREPFYLGSFEQIAHYRGGRSGRAKRFELGLTILPNVSDLGRQGKASGLSKHTFVFKQGETRPELCNYTVDVNEASAALDLSGERPIVSITHESNVIKLDARSMPKSELFRRDLSFFRFLLMETLQTSDIKKQLENFESPEALFKSISVALSGSLRTMSRSVFASAPVRYQPRRVYTPSELTAQNAGEQVPLQMANLKLTDSEKWHKTKILLSEFGKKAGLFDEIDIKRFGKTTSDPFQLQVKNSGPASNIVDVGYGVSQALPLLYPLQGEEYDFYLLQQPEVHLHPRAQAEFGSLIASLSAQKQKVNYVIETHSDYILDRIRLAVRSKEIKPKTVSILLFKRQGLDVSILPLSINEDGDVVGFPIDYREFFLQEQARILGI